ncbi:MAG: anhydro-N-acetylmuramic acid kinase [Reyranellaceae bacterium]
MLTAIGLMSGTSMDGIDAAVLRTDGETVEGFGPALTHPYRSEFRQRLRDVMGVERGSRTAAIEEELTRLHQAAVDILVEENSINISNIDVIGFHGQTIFHQPEARVTVQLGDGAGLAGRLGVPVAWDFRTADVLAGGQGAPFVPLFHAALTRGRELPVAVVNIGGVANVTWIGGADEILAFDTGPGNGPLDDWILRQTGQGFDRDGAIAARGHADLARVDAVLERAYFSRKPPKSLDRSEFSADLAAGLALADGAATLAEITAHTIAAARHHFPRPPKAWILCGGGRRNLHLVGRLRELLSPAAVIDSDRLGWNGDALEAQAFAFLAVRVLRGLPLSLPTTTGVPYPMPGGRISRP